MSCAGQIGRVCYPHCAINGGSCCILKAFQKCPGRTLSVGKTSAHRKEKDEINSLQITLKKMADMFFHRQVEILEQVSAEYLIPPPQHLQKSALGK